MQKCVQAGFYMLAGHHTCLVMSQSGSLPEACDKYIYDNLLQVLSVMAVLFPHSKDAGELS